MMEGSESKGNFGSICGFGRGLQDNQGADHAGL